MSYTPTTATKLTPDQINGMALAQQKYSSPVSPKQKQSVVMRAANGITNFVGARGIADQFGASLAEAGLRITGNSDAANLVEHPTLKRVVGSAIQAGANLVPVAKAASLPAKMAIGAATAQLADTGADLQADKPIKEAVKPGAASVVGASIPLAGAAYRQIGKLFGATGDKIQFSVIKPVKSDIEDGFSVEVVKKYNLGGSLKTSFQKTSDKLDDLSAQLNVKLSDASATVDLSKVFDRTKDRLLGTSKVESFGMNSQLGSALDNLGDEVAAVADNNPLMALKDANLVKRAAGHFGAWQYGMPDPDSKARERVYNVFYNELKEEIERQSPSGVKEINQQMHEIIPVMNALIRRIPVAERNNAISLTDVITLAASGIEPRLALLTAANVASRSGAVGNLLSKAGARMSDTTNGPLRDLLTKVTGQSMAGD